jgi:hypothetical protein
MRGALFTAGPSFRTGAFIFARLEWRAGCTGSGRERPAITARPDLPATV